MSHAVSLPTDMNRDTLIYLAPFQSITTNTFRRVYCTHFKGVSKCYTPFFAQIDHDTRLSERKLRELQLPGPGLPEVVPQILSKDPSEIVRFARICERMGFMELNWNLGCPYPQVADKKRGSGMMPYPDLIDDILSQVMPALPLKLSIKCRLGYEDKDEILSVIPIFNKYPVNELTIHGRIGRQLYSGEADNETVSNLLPLIKLPFVHNGDIDSAGKFIEVSSLMKDVKTWMIGRGILSNPFLPEEILGIESSGDRNTRLRSFHDDLYYSYRNDMQDRLTLLNLLKEYWDYLELWFPEPQRVKRIIKKAKTFGEYEDAVERVMENEL